MNYIDLTNDYTPSQISKFSKPSKTYEDYSLGVSGTSYTATASGWFMVEKLTGVTGFAYIRMNVNGLRVETNGSGATDIALCIAVPVAKGDSVVITFNCTGNTNRFRFYYDYGEV